MNIFVGNLSFEATEHDLLRLFKKFGDVLTITIIMDKNGVKSRGFGFIEMPDDDKARAAIAGLDGSEFMGRNLNVSPARPKPPDQPLRREPPSRQQPDQHQAQRPGQFQHAGRQRPQMPPRPSRIKSGRRSRSFLRRTGEHQAEGRSRTGEHQAERRSRSGGNQQQAHGYARAQAPDRATRWHQRHQPPVGHEPSRPWSSKELESGGEVVQVRRNLKPWEKRKSYAAHSRQGGAGKQWKKTRVGPKPAKKARR